jgi:hypothetical protein
MLRVALGLLTLVLAGLAHARQFHTNDPVPQYWNGTEVV